MTRICLALIGALAWAGAAFAQPVSIVGPVTPGNCPAFSSTTVLRDSGTPCGSNIFASNNTWTGTNTFVNPAFLPFLPAPTWTESFFRIGNLYSATYQVGLTVNQVVPVSSDVYPAYEADAVHVSTRTSDPSNINAHDTVAIAAYGTIASTNTNGRAWGAFIQGAIEAGGEGTVFGMELSVLNNGASQPLVSTITSKNNINLTTEGNPTTAGVYFHPVGPGWHKGIYAEPASITGAAGSQFIELLGKFTVAKTGFTAIGGTTLTAHPVGVQAESSGGLAIGIQGRASDGAGIISFYSNNLGTLYASLISNSASQLLSSSTFAPSDDGLRNNGTATNAWLGTYTRSLILNGATSGALTVTVPATVGTKTLTLPAGTTDFSATGPGVVQQASAGSAFTVGVLQSASFPALTGDVTTSAGSVATTLATVNITTGTYGTATQVPQVTANGKGLITTLSNVTITPAIGSITGLGTGVAIALAIAVGSAGGPVTNGGALGSPSSVGTLPAFTLGGTVSGGGNQINNIVIGTTTPLAGTFTTFQANTSGTVGTGTGTPTMAVNGSSSGTGGGAYLSVQNSGSGVIAFGNASAILGGAYDATGVIFTGAASFKAYVNGAYNFQVTNTQFAVLVTTDATSTSTGAIQNPGGMSVNKRVWMNGLSAASAGLSAACVENTGEITSNTGVTTCLVSAREWKTNIRALPDGTSNLLMAMRPRLFDWRDPSNGTPDHIGFIADEVASVDARLGVKGRVLGKDGVWSSWRVEMVTTLLVQGYQQHEERLKNLQADNDNLRVEVEQLKRTAAR